MKILRLSIPNLDFSAGGDNYSSRKMLKLVIMSAILCTYLVMMRDRGNRIKFRRERINLLLEQFVKGVNPTGVGA